MKKKTFSKELVRQVAYIYLSSKFTTISDMVDMPELKYYNLTRKNIGDILHSAISDNIVDDYTAEQIRNKAIANSERAYGKPNYKMRNLYTELFKKRYEHKKTPYQSSTENYSTSCSYDSSYQDYIEHMALTYDATYSDADEFDIPKSFFEDRLYS